MSCVLWTYYKTITLPTRPPLRWATDHQTTNAHLEKLLMRACGEAVMSLLRKRC